MGSLGGSSPPICRPRARLFRWSPCDATLAGSRPSITGSCWAAKPRRLSACLPAAETERFARRLRAHPFAFWEKHDLEFGTSHCAATEPARGSGGLRPDLCRQRLHRFRVRRLRPGGHHPVGRDPRRVVAGRAGVVGLRRLFRQRPHHDWHELALPPAAVLLLDHPGHGAGRPRPATPVVSPK